MIEITSAQNPQYKVWKSLLEPKGIKKNQQILIMGRKIVPEVIKTGHLPIKTLIFPKYFESLWALPEHIKQMELSHELFNQIDIYNTQFPIAVCPAPPLLKFEDITQEGLQVLCPLGDPSNLGATVRSALALGAQRILLTPESAHPFHPKAIRASSGAIVHAQLVRVKDINLCKSIIALDMNGQNLHDFKWPKDCTLIVGEEGPGTQFLNQFNSQKIHIPITNRVESLNAMAAISIALYSYQSYTNSIKPK